MKDKGIFAFIVGSPRSGTTVLGEILDKQSGICQWYEPYFVWDKYFRNAPNDHRGAEDATPKVSRYIYKNFLRYINKSKTGILVDKSPRNSLKIPFIQTIFPRARFVHIVRDGRDATLSINKEWNRRREIALGQGANKGFDYIGAFRVIKNWLQRQPFWLDRLRALWFETHGHILDKSKHLNRLRWNGHVGWGPRFRDWEDYFHAVSLLQFQACQWRYCVENVLSSWENIPEEQRLQIYYEDLVDRPRETLSRIFDFLQVRPDNDFFDRIPQLRPGNYNKWKNEFDAETIRELKPVLNPLLQDLGYLEKYPW